MSQNSKTIEIRTLNTSISVIANEENEARITEIAAFVKEKLDDLKKRNPMTNAVQVGILGCMNVTEQLFEESGKNAEAVQKAAALSEENQALGEELHKAKDACQLLLNEVTNLQEELKNLQSERLDQDLVISEKDQLLEQLWGQLQAAKSETEDCRELVADLREKQAAHESEKAEIQSDFDHYQEQLQAANKEIERCRQSNVDLQNQLFETQIELSKWKRD